MAFWGSSFVFNGIPCDDFDLMVYDVGNDTQGGGTFASVVSIIDESLLSKWRPMFYGVKREEKLTFDIVFGVNMERIDSGNYFDRYEIDEIATWLTGHETYKELEIIQDDMTHVRYKCIITQLAEVSFGNIPWAMRATVTCDSPFAYMYPREYVYELTGTAQTILFNNESSLNGYYKPVVEFTTQNGGTLSIVNKTDNDREFKFTLLPAATQKLIVDNENCVITCTSDINLYPYFNYKFLRLKRGYNTLVITGTGELKIKCEYPVNVGG